MPRSLGWVGWLFLAGCASSSSVENLPSPTAEGATAGTIPVECEALLSKSREWSYQPGQAWKPASPEQALEAVRFFGRFRLISDEGSEFYRAFLAGGVPQNQAEAEELQKAVRKVQLCDSLLTQQFLESLARYPWPRADKAEAARNLYQFVLNQQAMVLPLVPRLVVFQVYQRAIASGLVSGPATKLKQLQAEAANKRKAIAAPAEGNAASALESLRLELELSSRLRDQLSRVLPLP